MLSSKEVKRLVNDVINSIKAVRKLTSKRLGKNDPKELAKILSSLDVNQRKKLLDIGIIDDEIDVLLSILAELRSATFDPLVQRAIAKKFDFDKIVKELDSAIGLLDYFKNLNKLHSQRINEPGKTLSTEAILLNKYEYYKTHMITDLEGRINVVEPELKRLAKAQPSYLQSGLAKAVILLLGAISPSCATAQDKPVEVAAGIVEVKETKDYYEGKELKTWEDYYDAALEVRTEDRLKSIHFFQRAVEIDSENPLGYIGQATSYRFLSKQISDAKEIDSYRKKALELYELGINKLLKNNVDENSYFNLSIAYLGKALTFKDMEKINDALENAENAVKYNNSSDSAKKLLKELKAIKG